MKILILSYEFPPLIGGASTYARELAVGLSKNNCDVTVFTVYHGSKKKNLQLDLDLLKQYKIKIYRIRSYWKFFFIILHYKLVSNIGPIYTNKFDYIILADVRAIRYSLIFMKRVDVSKSVLIFHGGQVESFFTNQNFQVKIFGLRKKLENTLFKANSNIAVSKDLKEAFLRIIPRLQKNIHVVPHGIDTDIFHPISITEKNTIRKIYGINSNQFVIVSASRLTIDKGQDNLLLAFFHLHKRYSQARIIIAGNGNQKVQLEELCIELGIKDKVLFTGQLDRIGLSKLMASSDLAVMLSRIPYEAFGIVNIEANACGIPVLSSNIGGVPDSILDGITGLLVNPYDIEAICNCLKKLFNKQLLKRMKKNSVLKIKKNNTNVIMAKKTLNILSSS